MKNRMLMPVALIFFLLLGCGGQGADDVKGTIIQDVDATTFKKLSATGNRQLLDVRTPEEYAAGHLSGATNIDFYADDFTSQVQGLDRATPAFIYCASGGRSAKASKIFQEQGFEEVYNMLGGFGAWEEAGFEVEK